MPKKYFIVTALITGFFLAVLFGSTSFLVALSYSWAAQHVVLSPPLRSAVHFAYLIQRFTPIIAFTSIGAAFGIAFLISRTFSKPEQSPH